VQIQQNPSALFEMEQFCTWDAAGSYSKGEKKIKKKIKEFSPGDIEASETIHPTQNSLLSAGRNCASHCHSLVIQLRKDACSLTEKNVIWVHRRFAIPGGFECCGTLSSGYN